MKTDHVRRAVTLNRVALGELRLVDAAKILELSYRHAKRLYHRYRATGAAGLLHGNAGRRSNRAKPVEYRTRVMALARLYCAGEASRSAGPSAVASYLGGQHDIHVNVETLRRWMLEEGLWHRRRSESQV